MSAGILQVLQPAIIIIIRLHGCNEFVLIGRSHTRMIITMPPPLPSIGHFSIGFPNGLTNLS